MINKTNKLISLLLALILVFSCFAVFASAETAGGEEEEPEEDLGPKVIINRTYDEGWNYTNGTTDASKNNKFFIDREVAPDFSYNYFLRFECAASTDGYSQLNFYDGGYSDTRHVIVEFDIKADDYCNIGRFLYMRTAATHGSGTTFDTLQISNNKISASFDKSNGIVLNGDWVHVTIDYDYSDPTLTAENSMQCTITFDDGKQTVVSRTTLTCSNRGIAPDIMRFGFTGAAANIGYSFCLDNLQAYYNVDAPTDITVEEHGYGSNVNPADLKTIAIEGAQQKTNMDYIKEGLVLKVGVDYMLVRQEKGNIYDGTYGAPTVIDGEIYVPLQAIVDYLRYPLYIHQDGASFDISNGLSTTYITLGRDDAVVNGEKIILSTPAAMLGEGDRQYPVVGLNDLEALFPGYYVTYDDMGIIIFCEKDDVANRRENLADMLTLMKSFIFDNPTAEQIVEDITEGTNNFTHPYLIASQERFDELHAAYIAEEGDEFYDPALKSKLAALVSSAETTYKTYALPVNGSYDEYGGFNYGKRPVNPYGADSGGYDVGGRLNESAQFNNLMRDMALAYQLTRDIKYAKCVYDFGVCMGEWEHWGPGHFLNCADAATPYALAIDWCYNAFVELFNAGDLHYDVNTLIDFLYENATYQAYHIANYGGKPLYPQDPSDNEAWIFTATSNWNAVCSSGIIYSCLITMSDPDYRANASWMMSHSLEYLGKYGLDQYAPDGSYVESPGYWAYGTNSFFYMMAAVENACKTDYNMFSCWGMSETCYFACQTESSDYRTFNYHDNGSSKQDCSAFFYVSRAISDPALAGVRVIQLNGGKSFTYMDAVFYPFGMYDVGDIADVTLPLSYVMEGIDCYVARDSWEKGAMYAGIIGGDNHASHGQIDSGAFVYHNKGVVWFWELGSDNYNVYNYFSDGTRYRYYKCNAEGNNVLGIISRPNDLPYGQRLDAIGEIIESGENEHGSYAIIDNTEIFGGLASYARRGMFVTNDYKTVVIQDEVSLKGVESLLWSGHYRGVNVELKDNGRTAYMTSGTNTLRVSIVSDAKSIRFELMDAYTFFLKGTHGTVSPDFTLNNGGQPEQDRSIFPKLAIVAENVLSFNVAVVIEIITPYDPVSVGYTWTDMADWEPYADTRSADDNSTADRRGTPVRSEIPSLINKVTTAKDLGECFGKRIDNYYAALTNAAYVVNNYDADLVVDYKTQIAEFRELVTEYNNFVKSMKERSESVTGITNLILGM